MEATVQLNARIGKSLKESGDEALALIGLSPSQAVRALWEKASRRGKDLEEVADLLLGKSGQSDGQETGTATDSLKEMWAFMDETYLMLGIDASANHDMPSDEELLEQALCERLSEKGLA